MWLKLLIPICLTYWIVANEETLELPQYLRNSTQLLHENRKCVDEIVFLTANSLADRIDNYSLAVYCAKKAMWNAHAHNQRLHDSVPNGKSNLFTKGQSEWLTQLQNCTESNCLCSNKSCRNSLKTISKRQSDQLSSLKFSEINSRVRNSHRGNTRVIRKEYRRLTDAERQNFHSAMNQLKNDLVDGVSKFDLFPIFHTPKESPGAHFGAAFLPWHRELLKQFETALRAYDVSVSLPYWDSTLDEGLPEPKDSAVFTEEFFGDGKGYVTTGPYKDWRAYHSVLNQPKIVRNLGGSGLGSLYKPNDLDRIMKLRSFGDLTNCLNPTFELLHGQVHMWVGGHMADMPISANDPIFYAHHAFVDYQWEIWRQTNQKYKDRPEEYVADSDSCGNFHYGDAKMLPFANMRNSDGLANSYTDEFYQYEPRPKCKLTGGDCRSPYLFCYAGSRCLAKIRPGGNCAGLESFDSCLNSKCRDGICANQESQTQLDILATDNEQLPTTTRRISLELPRLHQFDQNVHQITP